MKHKIILLFLVIPTLCHATADTLFVNHITREMCWFDEDDYSGIGWNGLGEGDARLIELEKHYLGAGYKNTSFPYKIESAAAALCFSLMTAVIFFGRNRFDRRE